MPAREKVTLNWYNPFYGHVTNMRTAVLIHTIPFDEFKQIIRDPRLRIYTALSHTPLLTEADERRITSGEVRREHLIQRQRIKDEDGTWYIDEFGEYVYIQSYVGAESDVDLRYQFTKYKDTELFTLTPYQ